MARHSFVFVFACLALPAALAQSTVGNFAPHRPDLYRGELSTGFSGDKFFLTFTEETIYSLPFDVPQGIGEEFGLQDIQPNDVDCHYPETQCFDHLTFDWNPFGHPNNGWFQPHFDFHIYMIPDEIRLAIYCDFFPPCFPENADPGLFQIPEDQYMPLDKDGNLWYFDLESAIPAMGTHAFGFDEVETFDPSYFPLAGPDYKEWESIAFILGYYNGSLTFYEPMIPLALMLQRQPEVCRPTPNPQVFPISAYFPTTTCLRYDSGTWTVSLEGLRYVEQGQTPEEADENPKRPPTREVKKVRFSDAATDGIGSTVADRVYHQWIQSYFVNDGVSVNYDSAGRKNALDAILNQESDFGTTDSNLSVEDYRLASDLAIFPVAAGSVVPFYNIEGIDRESGSLTMSREVLARVFMRNITHWNDPAIVAENPGLKILLPEEEIVVVFRQDLSSGTTYVFTDALSKFSQDWNDQYGASAKWPDELVAQNAEYMIGADGDNGVFATVRARRNSIGYLGYNLLVNGFLRARYVRLINKAGQRVTGDANHVESATAQALFDFNFYASLADTDAFDGWPISSFSYLLVRKRFPRDCGRLAQALDFFATSMTRRTSREMTVRLGLSNVALQVRNVVFEEWDQIQCNGQRVFDSSKFQIDASSDVEFPPAPDNFSPFDPPSTPPFWDSQGSPIDNRGSRQYLPVGSRLYYPEDDSSASPLRPCVLLLVVLATLAVSWLF